MSSALGRDMREKIPKRTRAEGEKKIIMPGRQGGYSVVCVCVCAYMELCVYQNYTKKRSGRVQTIQRQTAGATFRVTMT